MAEAATLKIVLTDAGQPGGAPGVPAPGVTMPGAAGRAPATVAGVRPAVVPAAAPAQAVGMFRTVAEEIVGSLGLSEIARNLKASASGLVAVAGSLRAITVAGVGSRGAGFSGLILGVLGILGRFGLGLAAAGFALKKFTDVASGMAQRLARWVPTLGITEAFARLRAIQRERFEAAQLAPALIRFVQRREDLADRLAVILTPIKERLLDLLIKILEKATRIVEWLSQPDLFFEKIALEIYARIGPPVEAILRVLTVGIAGQTRDEINAWVAVQRDLLDKSLERRLKEAMQKLKDIGADTNLQTFMNMLAANDPRSFVRDRAPVQFGAFNVGQ